MTVKRCLDALARLARRPAWMTLLAITACGSQLAEESECRPLGPSVALPGVLRETSGVAVSLLDPGRIWTHNDGGRGSFLYAVDGDGRIQGRFELDQPDRDWWHGNC